MLASSWMTFLKHFCFIPNQTCSDGLLVEIYKIRSRLHGDFGCTLRCPVPSAQCPQTIYLFGASGNLILGSQRYLVPRNLILGSQRYWVPGNLILGSQRYLVFGAWCPGSLTYLLSIYLSICLILSYPILSHLISSYLILSYVTLSYIFLTFPIWFNFVLSFLILSSLVLSYLISSYLRFFPKQRRHDWGGVLTYSL